MQGNEAEGKESGSGRKKKAAGALFFVLIFVVCFWRGQSILKAKWLAESTKIVEGFYAEKKEDIDVLFVGASPMWCTVMPLELYREYGIAGYDFGCATQRINTSYLFLEEALKYQKPTLVVLETVQIQGIEPEDIEEKSWRWCYNDIRLSDEKLYEMYVSTGRKINFEYLSYVFPLFRYKDRWKELKEVDFTYHNADKYDYTKGYFYTNAVIEEPFAYDDYYRKTESEMSDYEEEYLLKICRLCEENDIDLLLMGAPCRQWTAGQDEMLQDFADAQGIGYLNYQRLYDEIGLVIAEDFRNANHLNNNGAYKVTMHLGQYIKDNYEIPDRRLDNYENSWDRSLKIYEEKLAEGKTEKLAFQKNR